MEMLTGWHSVMRLEKLKLTVTGKDLKMVMMKERPTVI